MKKATSRVLFISLFLCIASAITAQVKVGGDTTKTDTNKIDYANPKQYVIGGITVSGAKHMDNNVLILISGLSVGDKLEVPGDKTADAVKNIWKQGLFEDVKIYVEKFEGDKIYLNIAVVEKPRLSRFTFRGISKSDANDIRDKIKLVRGKVVTDYLLADIKETIISEFKDKGYSNISVSIVEKKDSLLSNSVALYINVEKGPRIKVQDIFFHGNTALSDGALRRAMKNTKRKRWYNVFHPSKLITDNFNEDKQSIIKKYNSKGYRDARIVKDTIYKSAVPNRLVIAITVDEGHRYYFGNISWVGNSKYSTKKLSETLGIKKGDVYNTDLLNQRLYMNPSGSDVSSLYMDDGYLFFQITPEEVNVHNDTIDMEMHIYEGAQARVNNVTITGNDKTNDKIIMRQIRTLPGDLFRRSDIIRTQRELAQLGYFDPEKMSVTPTPNPENGTVDINYGVVEKSSDQIELSGGWGGGLGFVGTAGISLNNFSFRNAFHKGTWRPIPTGDGEILSLRFQSNGLPYQSVSLSYTQPWVGGKHPNSLSETLFTTTESNGLAKSDPSRQSINIKGASVGFGFPLKFPDDFFQVLTSINYQYYTVRNYGSVFVFDNGHANSLSLKIQLMRNNVDDPTFETSGSSLKMSAEVTPPWSLWFGGHQDYADMAPDQKYRLLEFQKYKFTDSWYTKITNFKAAEGKHPHNLVLFAKVGLGIMGFYNPAIGNCPFNRFYLGGSGLTGYSLIDGREVISLRGYDDGSLSPTTGAVSITKYTLELRYPISLNPQATVWTLGFIDAGNSWATINQFNPFQIYRAAGVGVRIYLPMFGLLGFDYGWRFDNVPASPGMQRSQFIFSIGKDLGEL